MGITITCNNRPGSDHDTFAYGRTRQDGYVRTDPGAFPYANRGRDRDASPALSCSNFVGTCYEGDAHSYVAVSADGNWG